MPDASCVRSVISVGIPHILAVARKVHTNMKALIASIVAAPRLKGLKERFHVSRVHVAHFVHHAVHLTYLSAAAWEMHGLYSLAAGGLVVLAVIGIVSHVDLL
jgi:hypothetical protein